MIAEKLFEIHPLSYREGMLYISCAIEKDKHLKRKFKSLKPGNNTIEGCGTREFLEKE
jgi:hypothetical protein